MSILEGTGHGRLRAIHPRSLVLEPESTARKEYDCFQCRLRFGAFQSIEILWDSSIGYE